MILGVLGILTLFVVYLWLTIAAVWLWIKWQDVKEWREKKATE